MKEVKPPDTFLLGQTGSLPDPFAQFRKWLDEARHSGEPEPEAMNLATSDRNGRPSGRMVLLKSISGSGFVFFTNFQSRKGKEISENPYVALTFHWKQMERQVRVTGKVKKVPARVSDAYFRSRPVESRISAIISDQSAPVDSRRELEEMWKSLSIKATEKELKRPVSWGGYVVIPDSFEFWQGREFRLHDRISYSQKGKSWIRKRLSP